MRTAICVAGQLRTFDHPEVNSRFRKNLVERLGADVFIATWSNRGHSHWAQHIGMDISRSDEWVSEEQVQEAYRPTRMSVEAYNVWLTTLPNHRRDAALSPRLRFGGEDGCSVPYFYLMNKVSEMRQEYEREHNFRYDCVIHVRPDLILYRSLPKYIFKDLDAFWHVNFYGSQFWTVFVKTDLLISNAEHMDYAARAWQFQEQYWKTSGMGGKYNPYKAMYYHMYGHRERAIYDMTLYGTYRGDGDEKRPRGDREKMLEVARAKRAIRQLKNPGGPAVDFLLTHGYAGRDGIIWRG